MGQRWEHSHMPPHCSLSGPCPLPAAVLSSITHTAQKQAHPWDQGCLLQAPLREEAGAPASVLLPGWEGRQQHLSKEGSTGWAGLKPKPRLLSPGPDSSPAHAASGLEGAAGGSPHLPQPLSARPQQFPRPLSGFSTSEKMQLGPLCHK